MTSNQRSLKSYLLPLCLLLIFALVRVAKTNPQYTGAPISWKWTQEKWGGDDNPYLKIRKDISALYNARKLNDTELMRLKNASWANLSDSIARFRWAYYAYCYALLQPDISMGSSKLLDVEQAFRFEKSPGSYQYTRLRFLAMSYLNSSGPEMRALGERLLKRDPKDIPVKYRQVTHLNGGNVAENTRGMRYSKELVQTQPKQPAMYALLAFTYQNRWWGTHAKTDADAAIANYRKYMAMANLTGAKRKDVEKTIAYIQKG